jgi:hypothetical protein
MSALNPDLLELSTHAHDVRNRLSTIKSTVDLLLEDDLPEGSRDLLLLIKERALSAIDLSDSYLLSKVFEAKQYHPFNKEYPLPDLIEGLRTSIAEATGGAVSIPDPVAHPRGLGAMLWTGDEHVLLLCARMIARSLMMTTRQREFELGVVGDDGALCLEIECAHPGDPEKPLANENAMVRLFVEAVGGTMARLAHRPGFALTFPGMS